MSIDVVIPLLTIGGTLLLVVTGLLNYSVFVRQLRAARNQLDTARRQLDSVQQPEIQISAADTDLREKAHRERLLRHLQVTESADPLQLAKYSLEGAHEMARNDGNRPVLKATQ